MPSRFTFHAVSQTALIPTLQFLSTDNIASLNNTLLLSTTADNSLGIICDFKLMHYSTETKLQNYGKGAKGYCS